MSEDVVKDEEIIDEINSVPSEDSSISRSHSKYAKRKSSKKLGYSLYDIGKQKEEVKKVVAYLVENPDYDLNDMGKTLGMSVARCKDLMNSNNYLYAMRVLASGRFASLVPKALKSFEECLSSPNFEIRFKAAVKVLENEKVIGPSKIDLSVNDLRSQPIDKINQIIEMGQKLADQTILNAEVIH